MRTTRAAHRYLDPEEAKRKRGLRAAIASVAIGALIVIGLPTLAFADDEAVEPETQSEQQAARLSAEDPAVEPIVEEQSEPPAEEAPSEQPPAEEPPAEQPPAEEVPSEEPPAEEPPAEEAPSEEPEESDAPQQRSLSPDDVVIGPMAVPPTPSDGTAVISVRTVGTRDVGTGAIEPLAGVVLQLRTGGDGGPSAARPDGVAGNGPGWARCVSDAQGDCNFIVPASIFPNAGTTVRYWVVQEAAPGGWFANPLFSTNIDGTNAANRDYVFRTDGVQRNSRHTTVAPPSGTSTRFMLATGQNNNAARVASSGRWQNSLSNPPTDQQCGVDVALILDLSGSVNDNGLPALKNAANGFVDVLTGTSSAVSLFTFASTAPKSNDSTGQNFATLRSVATPAGATAIKNNINAYTAVGGTNWDRGLFQVAQNAQNFDVAIIITDGNPTFYGAGSNPEGDGNDTRFRELEEAIASANAIKAKGTKLIAFGVGNGVSGAGPAANLRSISGTQVNNDYFQTPNYNDAGTILRELAMAECNSSITVVKQVVPPTTPDGSTAGAVPTGGWNFQVDSTTNGATVDPTSGTTAANGALEFDVDLPGGVAASTIGISEVPTAEQAGFEIHPIGGKNAVCFRTDTQAPLEVTNVGTYGFTVDASRDWPVSCSVYNRAPNPAAEISVDKTWLINGQSYSDGNQPFGQATPNVTVDGVAIGGDWGTPSGGHQANDPVSIGETIDANSIPVMCEVTGQTLVSVTRNGTTTPINADISTTPYAGALAAGNNDYLVENELECTSQLTLAKSVANGPAAVTDWNLRSIVSPVNDPAPVNPLPGPNGVSGSGAATAPVTPVIRYELAEENGPAQYTQFVADGAVIGNGSTGTWACIQLDANGQPVPGGYTDGLNGGVRVPLGMWVQCTATNRTAEVTLVKQIPGQQDVSDWLLTLEAQGVDPVLADELSVSIESGETALVRPGTVYRISEVGPSGYTLDGIVCTIGDDEIPLENGNLITFDALTHVTCTLTNVPIQPTLELTKVVEPAGAADPTDWTLTATQNGTTVLEGDGHAGPQAVGRGIDIVLAESTDLPGADDAFTASWYCEVDGVAVPVTNSTLPALDFAQKASCTVTNTLKPVEPTVEKSVASTTPNADGTWTIAYDLVVDNPSLFAAVVYDLEDTLDFGGDISIVGTPTFTDPDAVEHDFTAPFTGPQQLATGRSLAADTSETWRVTVTASVAPPAFVNQTATCPEPGSGDAGGFLNTAELSVDGEVVDEAEACSEPVDPVIEKAGGTAVDHGDGTWTLPYTITVTNPSVETGIIYNLNDELDYPAGVDILSVAVTAAPDGVVTNPAWNGTTETAIATGVALAGTPGADAHVYEIAVVVRVTSGAPSLECPSDTALDNTATVTSGGQTHDASDCVVVETPDFTVDKEVIAPAPALAADGTWSITYQVTVTNTGTVTGVYDLTDDTLFGPGVSGGSFTVTRDGNPVDWNDGDLEGDLTLAGGTSHVYVISVTGLSVVTADGDPGSYAPADVACPAPGNGTEAAFNNRAAIVFPGGTDSDEACDFPSAPEIRKTGGTAAQQSDGSWNVSYTLEVVNTAPGSKAGFYDLSDTPGFPAGVTLNDYSIEEVSPNPGPIASGVAPVPTTVTVVEDRAIAPFETHVYLITFNVDVAFGTVGDHVQCQEGEPGNGFFNSAELTSGPIIRDDDDCIPVEEGGAPTIEKGDPTLTQSGDGRWTAVYEITVTGNPDFVSKYTLDDTLRFGGAVDIVSAEWSGEGDEGEWADPSTEPTETIVGTERVIGIDEVHVYTVTVVAEVDAAAFDDPTTNTCQWSDEESNVGFLNEAVITVGGVTDSDTGCATPAKPAIVKTVTGAPSGDSSGWSVEYTVTVTNTHPTQELVYDLTDTPDFSSSVTITDRQVTSADVTVNPAWNGPSPTTDTIVEDQALAGNATHTFVVTIEFTVAADAGNDPSLLCEVPGSTGGKGLLNGAVATSGDDYETEICADVPVVFILEKAWEINGTAFAEGDQPDGFSATGVVDGATTEWGAEHGPFALGDEVAYGEQGVLVPNGCVAVPVSDATATLAAAVTTVTITNVVDCTQTVHLTKVVHNEHGGEAESEDWFVAGTNVDDDHPANFGGDGTATGTLPIDQVFTLSETNGPAGYEVAANWSCIGPQDLDDAFELVVPGGPATTAALTVLRYGVTIDCVIENRDVPPTLTLVKEVQPEEIAEEFPADWWKLTAIPDDDEAPGVEGKGTASAQVWSNTGYTLSELAEFPEGEPGADEFDASDWSCDEDGRQSEDVVTLQPGDDVTCTIVNTAKPAEFGIEKTVTSGPIRNGDGTWTTVYDVTVTNESVVSGLEYTLVDSLARFGEGITVNEASWTGPTSGSWADPANSPDAVLATDRPLAKEASESYEVTVVATVSPEAWQEETYLCGEGEGGFTNLGTITVGESSEDADACGEPDPPADLEIEKTPLLPEGVTAVEAGDEFAWTLKVWNNGPADATGAVVTDTLTDQLSLNLEGAAITDPASYGLDADWTVEVDGQTLTFTTDATIGVGSVDSPFATITIPVVFDIPPAGPQLPENPGEAPPVVLPENLENEACVAVGEGSYEDNLDNNCDESPVPTKAIAANAWVQCENDIPWLVYDVQTTGSVEPGEITVTWTPDATVYPDAEPVVTTIPWDERSGRTIWPYGAVNEQGISIAWPGWRLAQEGDVVGEGTIVASWENMVKDSSLPSYAFADQDNPMTITFEINPSESVLAVYSQATPACAVDRQSAPQIEKTASVESVKPGGSFQYTLAVSNPGLGATKALELFDEIPADLKVTKITTPPAPAFPRWDDCQVTDADSAGYGGTLHCVLNGQIGGSRPNAPDIVLDVTLHASTSETRIDNTGEICWNDLPDDQTVEETTGAVRLDPDEAVLCADSTVTVKVPQPLASTGGLAGTGYDGAPWLWAGGILLLLGGIVVVTAISRRRREANEG